MNRPIEVHDFKTFGNMVKTWAKNPATRPTGANPAELLVSFKRQISDKEAELKKPIATVGPDVTELLLVPMPLHQLVIKLADPRLIEDTEMNLSKGAAYPLPDFYGTISAEEAQIDAEISEKLAFHAMRIGDYTIGNCV